MPKKFATENTKAVVARERKKQAKEVADKQKEKQLEDLYWQDDDKNLKKKQQRKEAEERKKQEALQRKAESKALLEKEMSDVAKKIAKTAPPPPKVTRAQIAAKAAVKPEKEPEKDNKIENSLELPLEENVNRLQVEGEEARTVDEAIAVLSLKNPEQDRHPEKRMKTLYNAFEEKRLNELKLESPKLRLSQLKQMIFKEWQKSPENPMCSN